MTTSALPEVHPSQMFLSKNTRRFVQWAGKIYWARPKVERKNGKTRHYWVADLNRPGVLDQEGNLHDIAR